ncbi:peptidylprolyl isomerase [Mycoplasmatota bacterium]|nr:peptidylprolyl isomerase [Mycoplasmatota bacterium]
MKKFIWVLILLTILTGCHSKTYTINFEADNGVEINSIQVKGKKIADLPIPNKDGYSFEGWYTSKNPYTNEFTLKTSVNSDITLYAKWQIKEYTINFNTNGGSELPSIKQLHGTNLSMIEPTKRAHTFLGWYQDEELTVPYDFTSTVNKDLTLYAKWKIRYEDVTASHIVTMEMEDGSIIKIELYEEIAPITVANFVKLVEDGFYDGLTFHRVIKGFMIQGGDPLGNGMGGPGYSIKGEFSANGVENPLKHERGVISMARSRDYDSAGSQFFIMHQDATYLDGQYAAFGRVVEGLDVVDQIANVITIKDRPYEEQRLSTVTVIIVNN